MLAEIAVESELVALDRPVLSEPIPLVTVESAVEVEDETELMPLAIVDKLADVAVLSDDKPVLSELTPVLSDETPVDSEDTPVLKLITAVLVLADNDETPVLKLETAVELEVESVSIAVFVAKSCEPLIASVLCWVTRPAATFVI